MNTTIPRLEGPDGYATPKLDSDARTRTNSETSPKFVAITPSDSADLATPVRALHVNTDGWIKVTGVDNTDGTGFEFYVLAGTQFPGRIKRVWATVASGSAATVVGLL